MSFQIDTAFVKQYHSNIEMLLQQKESRFRGKTRQEAQNGEEQFWEQVGVIEAQETNTRFADSPQMDVPHARRRVTLRNFDIGDFIDKFDEVKLLIDPSSSYVTSFVSALNRKVDAVVIDSFFGTAYTGKAGTTQVSFPTGNQIAVNYDGANSDLTVKKLIRAGELLESYENDRGDEPWYIATAAHQRASMLNSIEVTSRDFNDAQALVNGKISQFLGFEFIRSEKLSVDGSIYRRVPVWAKSGILLALARDIETYIVRRWDKRGAWYAYAAMQAGATRMQENKVLEIKCDETV